MRLTQSMQRRITAKLIDSIFEPKKKEMKLKWEDFGDFLYAELFSEEVRQQMEKLPEGWLGTVDKISIEVGRRCDVPLSKERRVPYDIFKKLEYGNSVLFAKPDSQFHKIYCGLEKIETKNESEEFELRQQVRRQLLAFTTVEKLVKDWPEISAVVREVTSVEAPPSNIVLVDRSSLNASLGLTGANNA